MEALQSGQPGIRNLQKLLLYSSEHPIPALGPNVDEDDVEDAKKLWEEDRLFERIFDGLMAFLSPDQVSFLLWTDRAAS
jgi:CLIP-associating protein 1/2